MDLSINPSQILRRVKDLITAPHASWALIGKENAPWLQVLCTYFIPLTVLSNIINFFERAIVGVPTDFGRITAPFNFTLLFFVISIIVTPIVAVLLAQISLIVCEKLKQPTVLEKSATLIMYASTPLFLSPILTFIPYASELSPLLLLFSVYLAAYGSGELLGLNRENQIIFGIGILGSAILLTIALALCLGPLVPQPAL